VQINKIATIVFLLLSFSCQNPQPLQEPRELFVTEWWSKDGIKVSFDSIVHIYTPISITNSIPDRVISYFRIREDTIQVNTTHKIHTSKESAFDHEHGLEFIINHLSKDSLILETIKNRENLEIGTNKINTF